MLDKNIEKVYDQLVSSKNAILLYCKMIGLSDIVYNAGLGRHTYNYFSLDLLKDFNQTSHEMYVYKSELKSTVRLYSKFVPELTEDVFIAVVKEFSKVTIVIIDT